VAKKVKKKPQEAEAFHFQFPTFDEQSFVDHEFEQTAAVLIAGGFAVLLGLISWMMIVISLPWFAPAIVGVVVLVLTPYVIRALRQRSNLYKWSDWAGLIAIEFFGWLAIWFLLADISPHML
jgi:hypothetical protein